MSAWDLTCRPVSSAGAQSSSASPDTSRVNNLTQQDGGPIGANSSLSAAEAWSGDRRFALGVPLVAPLTPSLIWNNLSPNKQLQALLATAARAAKLTQTINNNNNNNINDFSIDLVSPLEWLSGPRNLDLTRSPSVNLAGAVNSTFPVKDKLFPMTTSPDHLNSSNGQTFHHNQQTSSFLLSSSPVSSTGSSGGSGSSMECANPPLTKKSFSRVSSTASLSSRHSARPFPETSASCSSSSSSSSNSSDAELTGGGDASTSSGSTDNKVDRRARKKDQNRRAAYNYRRKKMEERDRMIEEEARLVHKHVRLAGKIARLEKKITLILNSKTAKIFDEDGQILCYSCPICSKHPCKSIQALREHLREQHLQGNEQHCTINNSQRCHLKSSHPLHSTLIKQDLLFEFGDDNECDSCSDSEGTINGDHGDRCDAFLTNLVSDASQSEDDNNSNNKKNHSL